MDATAIDAVRLNFNPSGLLTLNAVIGLMMFGIALDLKPADFTRILKQPKAPAIGLATQFILLPAFTFLLTLVLPIAPSIALGMILVAACPGGNLSNMMTYLAGGNSAVSVSMTAVSTAAAVVMTPLNLAVWGSLNPRTEPILREVSLNPLDVFVTIVMILGIPMALGMIVGRFFPNLVERIRKPFKIFAVIVFMAVVGGALAANWNNFLKYVGLVALVVALHNACALSIGYWSGRAAKLPPRDTRAVAIEVGIQNAALGLILVFDFFGGLGGMAIITAWWGVWHIIAGLTLAFFWSRRPLPEATA
ncbi:MAG: bile acid:sodium symporter family protein [Desulfarculaceae bacterium]|nr:bile acid:sodium symporter family protein [Desulfarculaceae bacterium]MCF8074128.1 bile acid:sodium symporter family protein [Desulfarculaceae bacterium]MCF8103280.1 bile acid:sodium symporter family protein [Desulfarculaceae bacterium]MCF8116862.1 bile acid:sodium symporter family protein [Desulfarculaceae bacterium]